MARATLKDKGQITLPAEIRKQIAADAGDIFDVEAVGGTVVMTPLRQVPANGGGGRWRRKRLDLSKFVGIASGTYGKTVKEMDAYVRKERDTWD